MKISYAEWEVMKIIWKRDESTSGEIISELKDCNWSDNTIRTLIGRLIAKQAVGISQKIGKVYTYVPLIKEKQFKKNLTQNFVKKVYDNSIHDLIFDIFTQNQLTIEELNRLNNFIKKYNT